jgi:hypothetical protein
VYELQGNPPARPGLLKKKKKNNNNNNHSIAVFNTHMLTGVYIAGSEPQFPKLVTNAPELAL